MCSISRWVLALGLGLVSCNGGVQALAPVESDASAASEAGREPSASDYSAHLDLLALGYDDGAVELRSPAPQHVLSRGKHDAAIASLAVSFDGQRLATVDRAGRLAVSETASGELKLLPRATSSEAGSATPIGLGWDRPGKRLAVAADRTVRLVEVDTGAAQQAELDANIRALAFSPDEHELVVGGNGVTFLSLPELKETRRLALPTEQGWEAEHPSVLALRFSPDGHTLGVLLSAGVALFDVRSQRVEAARLRDLEPRGLRFASDGRLAVFGRDALYVGAASADSLRQGLRKTNGRLWDVEFRRDDSLLFLGQGIDADVEALLQ